MKVWPPDPWALFSQKTGVVYASCILVVLIVYAYQNRIAPVARTVSLVVLVLVFAAFLLLAGRSKLTWADPTNALGFLLIAIALLLDGFFVAGAATFGPVPVLEVGVFPGQQDPHLCDFWREGQWMATRLSTRISDQEYEAFRSWADNFEYTNYLKPYPGRIQMSLWDRQVYWVSMKNRRPPMTIGKPPHPNPRSFMELVFGTLLTILSLRIYWEGKKRGIQFKKYEPPSGWLRFT
jgi:hypothetical protein